MTAVVNLAIKALLLECYSDAKPVATCYVCSQYNAWLHVYGEYTKANVVKVDGVEQAEDKETESLVVQLYKAQKIEVLWGDEKKLSTTLPVDGLKEAMKFCGYDVLYHEQFSNRLQKTN